MRTPSKTPGSARPLRAALLRAATIALSAAVFIGVLPGALVIATASPASVSERALPWWWNGQVCDAGAYSGSHPLPASYLGVQVCGPQPFAFNGGDSFRIVQEGPDPANTFGEGEWQCVELVMRFMILVYGVTPYGANGDGVVDNYSPANGGGLVKYTNGTPGVAPLPGDVLSFTDSISAGHAGVVTQSNVDANGNGSITMLSQNDTDDGWRTLAVTNWSVAGFTHHAARNWLHDPAGRGWGSSNSATAAWGGVTARPGGGYWAVTPFGKVSGVGSPRLGDAAAFHLNAPIVDIAATPSGRGYWLLGADGGIFSFGDAAFYGSTGAIALNRPVVGIAPTRTGHGYWLTATDGGIFSFGDAAFHGSTGNLALNQPVVAMAATPSGAGYWLAASDGGIFSFGDAAFRGSTGAIDLNEPIVGMAATAHGRGYWLAAADGGIFSFGDAEFRGSTSAMELAHPIAGLARAGDGRGYWLVESDGATVHAFGSARAG